MKNNKRYLINVILDVLQIINNEFEENITTKVPLPKSSNGNQNNKNIGLLYPNFREILWCSILSNGCKAVHRILSH